MRSLKSGADQQHHRQGNFADHQGASRPVTTAGDGMPCLAHGGLQILPRTLDNGTRPTTKPVKATMPSAKKKTPLSKPIAPSRGNPGGLKTTRARTPARAIPSPTIPPSPASSRLSVRSCRASLPRAAPSAARMANSARRCPLRASSRFVTLTQAITSTSNVAPAIAKAKPYRKASDHLKRVRECQ